MCKGDAAKYPVKELPASRCCKLSPASQKRLLRATTYVILPAVLLGACSQSTATRDVELGVKTSPRVVSGSRNIRKGGGHYKVGKPYKIAGQWYVPRKDPDYDRRGVASWYGATFHGRRTANGEVYDMNALTAGHPTLPLPSYAHVTNMTNGRTILVRINDRGPYVKNRLIDLSRRSARELGYQNKGLARVRVRYAGPAPLHGNDAAERRYLAAQAWYGVRRQFAKGVSPNSDSGSTGPIVTASTWPVLRNRSNRLALSGLAVQRASLGGPPRIYLGSGVFPLRAQAERLRHLLKGLEPVEVEKLNIGSKPVFRLLLGPFNEVEAKSAIKQVASLGIDRSVHILD